MYMEMKKKGKRENVVKVSYKPKGLGHEVA